MWIYQGKGEFLDGIPARDLTAADVARLSLDQVAAVESSRLYRRAPKRAMGTARNEGAEEPAVEPVKDEGAGATSKGATPARDKE